MRTLLDRKSFSSSSNGQVAAHRVTRLIIKRLWLNSSALFVHFVIVRVVRFSGDAAREGAEYPNTGLSPLWHRQRLHRSVPSARWAGRGGGGAGGQFRVGAAVCCHVTPARDVCRLIRPASVTVERQVFAGSEKLI